VSTDPPISWTTSVPPIIRECLGFPTDIFRPVGVSVPIGTGGAYATADSIVPPAHRIRNGRVNIVDIGSVVAGETITVKITGVAFDGDSSSITKSVTGSTMDTWLTDQDLLDLTYSEANNDQASIEKWEITAKSSESSTSSDPRIYGLLVT